MGWAGDAYNWTKDKLKEGYNDLTGALERESDQGPIDESNFQLQGQERRGQSLLQQADFAAGRGAPQIGQSGFRGAQSGLVGMLKQQAAGNGPSAAQQQLKNSLGRNTSSAQALLATGGPGGARAAQQQAGQLGGSLAGQQAQARVQEQLGAQSLLGQVTGQARGQDLQRQGMMSDAELRSRGLNDQQIARMREMELSNAQMGLQGTMGLESQRTQRRAQDLGQPSGLESILTATGQAAAAYKGGGG